MEPIVTRENEPLIPTPKRRFNWKKFTFILLGIVFFLALIVCIGISIYVGNSMTHPEKKPINQFPSDYGMSYDDITFMSLDEETELSGWVLHPDEDQDIHMTIIFGHGYKGNRFEEHISFFTMADHLLDRGYRVVLFDFRYAGESGGDMSTVGVKEQLDMLGAVEWVKENYDEPIGLLGISMGASTAMLTAAQSEDVIGVVADSPFSDLEDYLKVNLPIWSDLPSFPFTPLILGIMPIIADIDIKDASPISVLDDIAPRPVLFIHNEGDQSIPYTESEIMYEQHPDVFDIWLPDGEGHVKAFEQNEALYIEKVDEFFQKALSGS